MREEYDFSNGRGNFYQKNCEEGADGERKGKDLVLKLHLELVDYGPEGPSSYHRLHGRDQEEFLSLAKAEKGISRDILVPGEMNLHALHYAIQRLFGWQNSHLHKFLLSNREFDELTNGKYGPYADLCGLLFIFPNGDEYDPFWDDDYSGYGNIKSWLRKKYSAPYRCGALWESYLGNQWEKEDFGKAYPEFSAESTLDAIYQRVFLGSEWNALIERLSVGELFLGKDDEKPKASVWENEMKERSLNLEKELNEAGINEADLRSAAAELSAVREETDSPCIMQLPMTGPDAEKKGMEREFAHINFKNSDRPIFWREICGKIIRDWNVPLVPRFSELYYEYDFGDNWCVRITAEEREHNPMAYEVMHGNAVCVAADGMNVMDDCGGISGYLDLLQTLNGKDREEAEDMKDWAKSMGWSGRILPPEKML